ncbi:MAG TPA: four helix bundle suffix domain-containing protein [Candidatus Kapabacteria bacterium]|nr:four helix bundle suffix domain-containing protein [Candidatus Kapabacteria bacterium]
MGKINQYNDNGFIPKHGGYQKLLSFQKAEIVYDGTVYFCRRFFSKFDRTVDQMVQAARSGKQNIAEASMASGTSKSTEIKLTNVARASLEELLLDYRDFLRINHFKEWEKESPYYKRMTELNKSPNQSYETYRRAIENEDPEICANAMIGLIKVTNFLLDRQLKRLEEDFLREGGFKEKMTNARLKERKKGT